MAKSVAEKPVCEACGADVRAGSLFCYNCGGPVTAEAKRAKKKKTAKAAVSDAWFNDELSGTGRRDTNKLTPPEPEPSSEPEPTQTDKPIPKPGIYEEAKLRTAASMRRKGKSIERKSVEVVWEAPEVMPGARFILAALSLTLVVVLIYFAAAYFK